MNKYIPLFILLVSSFCQAEIVVFENDLFHKYTKLLSLELEISETKKASGFYGKDTKGNLNGEFRVGFTNSGHDAELETDYSFINIVRGEFKSGKKEGTWKYEYTSDDGIDMYESHLITLTFQSGNCTKSSFYGAIGHLMPKTNHTFSNSKLCSPKSVREKAWELWGIKYESEKANGGL